MTVTIKDKISMNSQSTQEKTQFILTNAKYALSFTNGGLLLNESVKLAVLFMDLGDWKQVRDVVVDQNLLQIRTLASSIRLCQEICSRLKTLRYSELKLLVEDSLQDQGYILWLAICRRYRFIQDFAVQVVREKFLSFNPELRYSDFDTFFNEKARWHPELDAINSVTRVKARSVLFKMLQEAKILTADRKIVVAMLSSAFITELIAHNRGEICFFPVLELQIKELSSW